MEVHNQPLKVHHLGTILSVEVQQKQKWRFYDVIEQGQIHVFLPSAFSLKSFLQNQNFTFTEKFRSYPRSEVLFFSRFCHVSRVTASRFSAFWLCLDLPHFSHNACWEKTEFFDRQCFPPFILEKNYKSRATSEFYRNFALVVFFNHHNFQKLFR